MKRIACSGIGLALSLGLLGLTAGAQNQDPSNAQSSSSDSSLGNYARQIRKDPGSKPKQKVFDNDNLPTGDKLSIVGPTAAATPSTDNSADAKPAEPGAAAATTSETKAAGDTKAAGETKLPDGAKAPDGKTPEGKTSAADKAPDQKLAAKSPEEYESAKQAAWKQWGDKVAAQKEQIDLLARELEVLQREYQIRAAAMYADAGNRMRNEGNWDKQDAQYKQQIADKQKALDDAKQKLDEIQEDARKAGVPASVREP